MVVDRGTQRVALMASSEGGMAIEEVAAKTPRRSTRRSSTGYGTQGRGGRRIAAKIGIPAASVPRRARS